MYLLGPFYQWLVQLFDGRVNHLPLVRLFIFSVDHAIVLFIGWLIVWSIYLFSRKKGEIVWKWELYRNLFIFYIILLAQLTIFRSTNETFTLQIVSHPLSDIMWVPFVDSIKLFMQGSVFAAYYNVVEISYGLCRLDFSAVCSMEKRKDTPVRFGTGSGPLLPSSSFNLSFTQESAISTTFSVMCLEVGLDSYCIVPL